MRLRQLGLITAAGGLVMLAAALPAAADSGGSATVGTAKEAWYHSTSAAASGTTVDPCVQGVPCTSVPPNAGPYPANTLQIGVSSGQTTEATYLQLNAAALPSDVRLTGGMLTLPVDMSQSDGSVNPDTAKMIACDVSEPIADASGGVGAPPVNCAQASSPAKYVAGAKPVFTVDLAPFSNRWSGQPAKLALLPDPAAASGNPTWHVTLWGKQNTTPGASPISAKLSYTAGSTSVTGGTDGLGDQVPTAAPTAAPAPGLPVPALGNSAPGSGKAPPAKAASKPPAPSQRMAAPPRYRTVRNAYPIAWLMPLLLVVGFVATGRSLTKELGGRSGT